MDNVAIKLTQNDVEYLKSNNCSLNVVEIIANREGFSGVHNAKLIDCGNFYRLLFDYENIIY